MGLEIATYLADLVPTNPPGTDSKSQGDDHLRLIKAALQATFPNAIGPRKLSDKTNSAADTLTFTLYRDREAVSTPVALDLLASYAISGNNSAQTEKVYARMQAQIIVPTTGAEDGAMLLYATKAGVETVSLEIRGDDVIARTKLTANVSLKTKGSIDLFKAASGNVSDIASWMTGTPDKRRWLLRLGNEAAESSTRTGSDFALYSYDNAGAAPQLVMHIPRATSIVNFPYGISTPNLTTTDPLLTLGPSTSGSAFGMQRPITNGSFTIYGGSAGNTGAYLQLFGESHATNGRDIILGAENGYRYFYDYSANRHYWANNTPTAIMNLDSAGSLTILGTMYFDQIIQSTGAACYIGGSGGVIYLRPNGAASATEQWYIDTAGNLIAQAAAAAATGGVYAGKGLRGKAGSAGGYSGSWMNLYYTGGFVYGYVDGTAQGFMNSTACDYRMKRNVAPLGSTWDKVKSLNPIKYNRKDFELDGSIYSKASDEEEWGFLAHELQESLTETSASGTKDSETIFQVPNFISILSAVTASLQEAMERIETLEAKVAA